MLLVKAAHGLAGGMGLVHHPAQRQNGCGIYFCFKHNQLTHLMLLTRQWPCRVTPLQAAGTSTSCSGCRVSSDSASAIVQSDICFKSLARSQAPVILSPLMLNDVYYYKILFSG